MNSNLCHGVTLKGKPCTKRTLDSTLFCHHHKDQANGLPKPTTEKDFNSDPQIEKDECCVCYEMMPVSQGLSCKHLVCKVCLEKMRDDRCPMCRSPLKLDTKAKKEIQRRRVEDNMERHQIHFHVNAEFDGEEGHLHVNADFDGEEGNINLLSTFNSIQSFLIRHGDGSVFGFRNGQPFINPYGI